MPKHPPFVGLSLCLSFLLLSTISLFSTATTTTSKEKFREAPQFYNSPDCPSIFYTSDDHHHHHHHHRRNTTRSGGDITCSATAIHIAMTLDATYLRGSMAAIFSVLQHSACPQNIVFHFIVSSGGASIPRTTEIASSSPLLRSTISSTFPYLHFEIYPFDANTVSGLISTSIRSALDTPLNYARSYLSTLLPRCVRRVTYLDSDTILVDDISKLSNIPIPPPKILAAPEYCNANFTAYFTPTFWSNPSLSHIFKNRTRPPCYFNTGVMVIDLERWRRGDYTRKIEEWMVVQKRMRIYELGSLPPFLLVFAGEIVAVDHRWNQHGLGGDNYRGLCRDLHPGPVSLLHWSGKGKPWVRLDSSRPCPLDALWAPYDLMIPEFPSFGFDS